MFQIVIGFLQDRISREYNNVVKVLKSSKDTQGEAKRANRLMGVNAYEVRDHRLFVPLKLMTHRW